MVGRGSVDQILSADEVREIVAGGIPARLVAGKKVLVLTPDITRTAPLPLMVRTLVEEMGAHAAKLDFMVALGTHPPMAREQILRLYGISPEEAATAYQHIGFFNHRWDLEDTLVKIGRIDPDEIDTITQGHFRQGVDVVINRRIFEYDLVVILGPVFPHEVAGFSGGHKYFFPGISGGDLLHFTHWLGAVVTNWSTIGIKDTPVRRAIERAASLVKVERLCISMVVKPNAELAGLFVGEPAESWSAAADLSAQIHVVYKPSPYRLVLGRAPEMYEEMWTAGKVMYKLEPVVADGGRLIIYAPHIRSVSSTWGRYLERVGYHVRDYFLKQLDRFRDIPLGVLAHSTHVKGLGVFEDGRETPRIDVVLATSIPEEACRRINLGYMDYRSIDIEAYQNREDEGVLFVDHAGEVLHRLVSR